ncbi:hypothetical protein [Candidatus Nanosynbacter lyticus]|uniref:hypothetical protein n=1 Tax=Candidatus Nanosynbacter lyticus TaxID=2093824 RepID=UPI00138D0C54|nr:hypothetical protein [Candidatus Nanosynbacter lyticus]QHU91843.1 hypothetical protein GWK76_00620 [Candidatus Saccharibacteria bacterium oral taxon 488]
MKNHITNTLRQIMKDRWLLGLVIVNILLASIIIISFAVTIKPKETQVIVQHSAFSVTGLYRGHWYSLWTYGVLQLMITVGHIILSAKLAVVQRRDLALALLWLTIAISVILALFAYSIIVIASVV